MGTKLKNLLLPPFDQFRMRGKQVTDLWGFEGDESCGAFLIPTRRKRVGLSTSSVGAYKLKVICSGYEGWDHVSVSLPTRCPTWEEMEFVKRMFFQPDAVCYQLHVAESEHLSHHPFCLHIWRPHDQAIPLPPPIFVAMPKTEPCPSP